MENGRPCSAGLDLAIFLTCLIIIDLPHPHTPGHRLSLNDRSSPGQCPALGIRVPAAGRVSLLSVVRCKGYRAPLLGSSETISVVADTSETEECNG